MHFVGIPGEVLDVRAAAPSAENRARLNRFLSYYRSPSTGQELRKAVLCLALTEHALNISSSKSAAASEPTLVRLAKGEVQEKTMLQFDSILSALHVDPDLDITDAVGGLLVTQIHILHRYREFAEYPFRLYELTERFNPTGFIAAIELFLGTDSKSLDVGFSLPLQQEAWSQGPGASKDLAAAIRFLIQEDVQEELVRMLTCASASSLDVERAHVQVKRAEKNKVVSVAVASRNYILGRWLDAGQSAVGAWGVGGLGFRM